MNLFNYKKKSKVAYTFWGGEEARALFKPPEIINSKPAGCPAMYGIRDRLVGLYPPMSIDLTIYNDGELRYEYELNQKDHHDHLVCSNCGSIEEFMDATIEKKQMTIAQQKGYILTDHRLTLYGICPNCQKSSSEHDHNKSSNNSDI